MNVSLKHGLVLRSSQTSIFIEQTSTSCESRKVSIIMGIKLFASIWLFFILLGLQEICCLKNCWTWGLFTCSILASIVAILVSIEMILTSIEPILEKMCSPASVILASIVTIIVSFQAILKIIPVIINFQVYF